MADAPSLDHYFTCNRTLWNAWTQIHAASAFYDVAGFRSGKSSLNSIELAQVGDVRGKTMLHLQCHFGLDTLSWARLGARVTGVDFSDQAIALARDLAADLHLGAEFVCANVYALDGVLDRSFDVVYTSYGVLGWLPDLGPWAQAVAKRLVPGGVLQLVEFHPVVWMLDDTFQQLAYSYFNRSVIVEETRHSYADPHRGGGYVSYGWNHALSEVIGALLAQGLVLDHFAEYDFSPYNCLGPMCEVAPGRWRIVGREELPLVYSLTARRPMELR